MPISQQIVVRNDVPCLATMDQVLIDLLALQSDESRRPFAELQSLTAVRLKISKATRQRALALDTLLAGRMQSASLAEMVALLDLRRSVQLARSKYTAHVAAWTPQAVIADWPGYGRASLALRKAIAAQIISESKLLYPV